MEPEFEVVVVTECYDLCGFKLGLHEFNLFFQCDIFLQALFRTVVEEFANHRQFAQELHECRRRLDVIKGNLAQLHGHLLHYAFKFCADFRLRTLGKERLGALVEVVAEFRAKILY